MNLFLLLFASIVTSNIALTYFLGMCPFVTLSKNVKVAFGMGVAVTFVMTVTATANYLINTYVLIPWGLQYLQYLVFIVTIAALVQVIEIFLDRYSPSLYAAFGIFLPLITVNCAILGVSLFVMLRVYDFWQTVVFGFGSGVGWMVAIIAIGGLRKKLIYSDVPENFTPPGITAIIAGIMALAFIGFTGMASL